ncbi:MAG: response regulator transcription factor [Chitinophagaceae bacterium]
MPMYKILIVEDDRDISEILQFNLENEGYLIEKVSSSEKALDLNLEEYHLILLDVMMAEMNGFTFAQKIKLDTKTASIPIIFITARIAESDVVKGLNLGAEDYVIKPFSIQILLAKIKNIFYRIQSKNSLVAVDIFEYKDLRVNLPKKEVTIKQKRINLTKTEFKLLVFLLQNSNKLFQRNEILAHLWEDTYVVPRTVDVHLTRLRKKIVPYGELIISKIGYGYSFITEDV